jgi:hypothetical protein
LLAAEPNKPKILKAPVTVIIGHDLDLAGELPKLLPHNAAEAMQKYFAASDVAEVAAMRNGTLQGAYLIIAAQASEFVAQGDRVLVVGVATGKIKATNKPFKDNWVFDITVRDGKVTNIREYIDTQALARASQRDASGLA